MVGVVIVTFNRLEKLKQTLKLFECQTSYPEYILIVNNASTDGTDTFLNCWLDENSKYEKYVINTGINLGGSGGFNVALNEAIKHKAEWIWISDDDAFPAENAIEMTKKCIGNADKDVVAICGKVMNCGEIDISHRKRIYVNKFKIVAEPIQNEDYVAPFELNAFSYVGAIVKKEILEKVGVTKKEYFIWYDDTEHSLRISKEGKIMCFPEIVINHDVGQFEDGYSWKSYYSIRNRIDMYRCHFPKYAYYYELIKRLAKAFLSVILPSQIFNEDEIFMKMYRRAVFDAISGKFGVSDIYKPGWKVGIK